MARPRIIATVLVVRAAVFTTWWLLSDGLSAEERRLVGTWRPGGVPAGQWGPELLVLNPDRLVHVAEPNQTAEPTGQRWHVGGGRLYIDNEPNLLRRALRPLLPYLGLGGGGLNSGRLEWISDDEIALVGAGAQRAVWVRVRKISRRGPQQ